MRVLGGTHSLVTAMLQYEEPLGLEAGGLKVPGVMHCLVSRCQGTVCGTNVWEGYCAIGWTVCLGCVVDTGDQCQDTGQAYCLHRGK